MEYRATILPGAHKSSFFTPAPCIIPIGKFPSRKRVLSYGPTRCSFSGPPPSSTSQGTQERVDVAQGSQSSYLAMWQNARQRQEEERRERDQAAAAEAEERRAAEADRAANERRAAQFASILEASPEERKRAEKQQVVDRAAAALAAVEAVLKDADAGPRRKQQGRAGEGNKPEWASGARLSMKPKKVGRMEGPEVKSTAIRSPTPSSKPIPRDGDGGGGGDGGIPTLGGKATPGPDFWTWSPPSTPSSTRGTSLSYLQRETASKAADLPSLLELDPEPQTLGLARETLPTIFQSRASPSLPPLQSLMEVVEESESGQEAKFLSFSERTMEVPEVQARTKAIVEEGRREEASSGIHPDGARWWKDSGTDVRPNGEVCDWTVIRGVSADGRVEFEEKFWETSDKYDYKELGAEKSGRMADGDVWRETWKEAMWQDAKNGLPNIEKSADKWACNGAGGEWHEKWWEHYNALGKTEKWADKWSKIDESTPLDAGHAHVWHERWGEEYDGKGYAMKYSDKWAERSEGGGVWTKWGDKWDEQFAWDSKGRKGGETWWEGGGGERWNRTWGEEHNTSGWVHKYGNSSSGEHWDTHEPMETRFERKPHFGFKECLEHSWRLQQVGRKENENL